MSSSLSVYLIDPEATRALVGCGDDQFLASVHGTFREYLEAADREFSSLTADSAIVGFVS